MTTIYFVRHAQSDWAIKEENIRPLSEKGLKDREFVTEYLKDKDIDLVFSSPYKRAFDTVHDFAQKYGFEIDIIEDFRERKVDSAWVEDFISFAKKQWEDFSYKLSDGENLNDVQRRNISALNKLLHNNDKNIVIGTHGTALSTIINHYDKTYRFEQFQNMVDKMPWVVKMFFDGETCVGMQKIDLFNPEEQNIIKSTETYPVGYLKAYRFVVIFSRYQNKWLYCRAKTRDSYETAGGHIELDETPLQAAKRELYEETGAIEFDMEPTFDYLVNTTTEYSHGQVFFAQIHKLGDIPNFEMEEVKLFDAIPEKMRFPEILPVLYEKMQGWLNLQSAKDEIWDVYDENRNLTGRTHRRIDPLAKGDYHLVVHVWLQNSKGEFLITKRAPNKGFPNMWECTGGSAVVGDDSITAAIREVKEETGLDVIPEKGELVFSFKNVYNFCDIWLFKQDFNIKNVVLQEGETIDAMYASKETICKMVEHGEFIKYGYIEDFFENGIV